MILFESQHAQLNFFVQQLDTSSGYNNRVKEQIHDKLGEGEMGKYSLKFKWTLGESLPAVVVPINRLSKAERLEMVWRLETFIMPTREPSSKRESRKKSTFPSSKALDCFYGFFSFASFHFSKTSLHHMDDYIFIKNVLRLTNTPSGVRKRSRRQQKKGAEGKMYWETGLLGEENLEKWKERTNSLRRQPKEK